MTSFASPLLNKKQQLAYALATPPSPGRNATQSFSEPYVSDIVACICMYAYQQYCSMHLSCSKHYAAITPTHNLAICKSLSVYVARAHVVDSLYLCHQRPQEWLSILSIRSDFNSQHTDLCQLEDHAGAAGSCALRLIFEGASLEERRS